MTRLTEAVRRLSWGDVFNRYLRKGHDHGSAAYAASKYEERCARAEVERRAALAKARGEPTQQQHPLVSLEMSGTAGEEN